MKGAVDRRKVVVRHLPPTLSQSMLLEHVDSRFAGRYNWFSFRPAKTSQKHQRYSRAYIDFKRPEDVIDFAEFFDGHVFVNEKGTQFRAMVEYAPSQRVPKSWSKKDGREGTILKDPDYLEFLEFLTKPIENLPSAEIQLERKAAERAGSAKDTPIVTPLMDYIRQKRAAKSGNRRSISNGKSTRSLGRTSSGSPSSSGSKRGFEKKRISTTMYVIRDSSKAGSAKDKAYVRAPKRDDQQLPGKFVTSASASGFDAVGEETGGPGAADGGKKKILLVKGKEKEITNASSGPVVQQNVASTPKNTLHSAPKHNQRHEPSGRIIRSILLKDDRQNQSSTTSQSEQHIQDKDKKPPRPPSMQSFQKDTNVSNEDKVGGNDYAHIEKQEKRSKNRDRPDRGVWAPLRRSDSPHSGDEFLPSSTSQSTQAQDLVEGMGGEMKKDILKARSEELRAIGSGRSSHASVDNGTYKHGRHGIRDPDGTLVVEGKPLRRGSPSGYGPHEKQVWVQKSSSGS